MKDLEILRELAREYAVYALDGRSVASQSSPLKKINKSLSLSSAARVA